MVTFVVDLSSPLMQAVLSLIVVGAITVASLIKFYAYVTCGYTHGKDKMEGKTAVVTGATGGIGKETTRELAKRGARVIIACRNVDAGNKIRGVFNFVYVEWSKFDALTKMITCSSWYGHCATSRLDAHQHVVRLIHIFCAKITLNRFSDEIVKDTGNEDVVVKKLDLASQKSIRDFATELCTSEERLHVLVHNAGTAESRTKVTEDGLELTMATNHFGPFLLTHLLIGEHP